MLVQAMEYATGPLGRWHDAMENLQNTPAGQWIAFTGTVRTLAGTIGLALLPALGKVTEFLTALINNKAALYEIAIGVGAMTTAWMLYTAWMKIAAMATEKLTIETFLLEAFTSPEAVILGIGLVSAALGGLILIHTKLNDSVSPVMDGLIKKNDDYGTSAINAANKVVDANGRIAKSSNDLKKNLFDFGKLEDGIANQKIMEGLAFTKEQAFLKKHGSLSDKDILKIRTQVGLLSPDKGLAGFDGKYHPTGADRASSLAGDTTNSITGGGVRNITINVAKFQDKTEIHSISIKEGVREVEEIMQDMFLRIVNSASAALS